MYSVCVRSFPEPAAFFKPREGPFYNPPFGQHGKGMQFIALDDLNRSMESLHHAVSKRLAGVFSAMVYVLRTGCQWKALPQEYGSGSAVHQHFQDWQKAGFFLKLWQAGLAEYDGMQGIAWEWQSIDGAMGKAPLARECAGSNPTDRGKKGAQAKFVSGRPWRPAVARRQRSQSA